MGANLAIWRDDRREPGISCTDKRNPVFYRAHRFHDAVRIRRRRAAEPGVIGDVHKKLRAVCDEASPQVWENAFETDENAKLFRWQRKDHCLSSCRKVANAFDQFIEKEQKTAVKG